MTARHRPRDDERGSILPIAAIVMIVLFGFAALGVDLTAAYAERRQAQATADAAVLAAGLEFLGSTAPSNTDLYNTIKAYTVLNWEAKAPSDGEWATCSDPNKPSDYAPIMDTSVSPAVVISDCISIKQVDGEPALLRVRLPAHQMDTSFASLIGFDTVGITATATAELRYRESSNVLPFTIPADAGGEECLATPPSGLLPNDTAPCGGPTQGNFGMIDSPWFGEPDAPHFTDAQSCPSSPNFNTVAPHNIAIGLDHVIRTSPNPPATIGQSSGPPAPAGADSCASAASGDVPYVLLTETGNTVTSGSPSIMEIGFLGDDPSPTPANSLGRLRQPSNTSDITLGKLSNSPAARMTFRTNSTVYTVDNVGLWEYLLDPSGNSGACDRSTYASLEGRELTEHLVNDCLANWSSGVIFDDALLESTRFAVVPRLNYLSGSQFGSKWWDVLDLQAVYLHTSWYTCTNGSDNECLFLPEDLENATPPPDLTMRDSYSILFSPGEGEQEPCYLNTSGTCVTPNANRFEMRGISALVLDWDMFSTSAQNQYGGDEPFEVFLYENE